jgi:Ca-activated chloride channel family protein
MITFSDEPEAVRRPSTRSTRFRTSWSRSAAASHALLDAIYTGVSKMRQAKYAKKALLIISDGGDNHSRYTEGEIKSW